MSPTEITIPIAPITKKNHQQILTNRATGRPFVAPSTQYKTYERQCLWHLKVHKPKTPIDTPVNVKCIFYLPTRRKTDLTNLLEAVDDILVKAEILADDNYTILVAHDGSRCRYDKENPRTEILITEYTDVGTCMRTDMSEWAERVARTIAEHCEADGIVIDPALVLKVIKKTLKED